jgi:hypothetical protein
MFALDDLQMKPDPHGAIAFAALPQILSPPTVFPNWRQLPQAELVSANFVEPSRKNTNST